ncbi:modular serine protease-like [Condylostylus longicornis]|uniref:modular serine protease-like n=1 Tax=Condylostylus longicornis TaxID=2530218 RepID=UPI00244DC6E1|nr:modular serine protease-like [Condylostylus longicornis]
MISTPKCLVPPGIDYKKIEVLCYDIKRNHDGKYHLFEDQCSESTEVILTRCQVGYANRKSRNINDYLNKCVNGKWENEGRTNDDCELICGQNLESRTEKPATIPLVYNGKKIESNNVPWHVAIYKNISSKFEQICGGSIVHSNVILSAAHCFYDPSKDTLENLSKFSVAAGKRFRNYEMEEQHEQFARIKKVHVFGYSELSLRNDIAVVSLDRHLQYSPYVEPVCINWSLYSEFPSNYENVLGHLYGWGATSDNMDLPLELLKIELEPIPNDICKEMVPNFEITSDVFCAINKENSTACSGDGGGGLVIENKGDNNLIILLGTVSHTVRKKNSFNSCSDGTITIFTDIKFYQYLIKPAISKSRDLTNESLINVNIMYE